MVKRTFILIALLLLAAIAAYFAKGAPAHTLNQELEQADSYYQIGETAQNPAEKEDAFNRSLTLYLQLEQHYAPADSKLYTNIGNAYFQLGHITQAILYYNRALKFAPRDMKARHNLAISNAKLRLPPPASPPLFTSALIYQLFALSACLTIAFCSYAVWTNKGKTLSWLFFLIALSLLGLIGYRHYFTPLGGILIKASGLYLDAGEQYATVLDKPLPAGAKVSVLAEAKAGAWIKIRTPEGSVGYVPQASLRVI